MPKRWKSRYWCWWLCAMCTVGLGVGDAAAKMSTAAQQALIKKLWRGTQMERARAMDRLGRERVWRARPALRKMLAQKKLSMQLRVSAILALGRLRDTQSNAALLRFAAGRYVFMTRISAIWSLVKLQQKASLPVLIRILKKTRKRRIREYAAWAIGTFRDPSTAKHLRPMLSYTHDACAAARRVLRKLGLLKKRIDCSNAARKKRRAANAAPKK